MVTSKHDIIQLLLLHKQELRSYKVQRIGLFGSFNNALNKKDSDIISSIIGNYSGLTSDVSATTTVWPEQVQYYVTDWDYILTLAETNGLIITTINGNIIAICEKPERNQVIFF